jgi:hypothetical protein
MLRGMLRRVRVSRVSVAGVPAMTCMAEMRRVADVSAVPTMAGMTEMSQPSDRHRGQPGTAEREAETIKVHTKYYVSNECR